MAERLTVVLPLVTDEPHLTRCLQHLERERDTFALGVCAVSRLGSAVSGTVSARFPWVRLIEVDGGVSIPAMRALGVDAATGEVIAVIEDHILVPPGWARRMYEGVTARKEPVAGPVENGAEGLAASAAFLTEYSHLLPPVEDGATASLPGNNTGYPAVMLKEASGLMAAGAWEDEVHAVMRARGVRLWMSGQLVATHALELSTGEYMRLRYHFSRAWAGRRRGAAFASRSVAVVAGLVLPAVLLMRIVRRSWPRPRYRRLFLKSLHLQMLFVVTWSMGEIVGILAGPGHSLAKVR